MLTRHQKPTRAQRFGGLAGIGALTLAGLAVTASGTEAAENLKASVAERTGVDIDRIELPELPLPPAPVVQVAVPAPPAPPAAVAPPEAKEKRRTHVYSIKDGDRVFHWSEGEPIDPADKALIEDAMTRVEESRERVRLAREQAGAAREHAREARRTAREALVNVPEIRSMNCDGDGPFQEVTTGEDGKKRILICTNRIERHAATAQAQATASADLGRLRARSSIDMARRAIERDHNLSDNARAEALAGLDKALAEMDAERRDHH